MMVSSFPRLQVLLGLQVLLTLTSSITALRILPRRFAPDASLESLENEWHRHLIRNETATTTATADAPTAPNGPEDHLVTDLPLLDSSKFSTEHWAGLLPASTDRDKYLFYWLFAPDLTAFTDQPDLQEQAPYEKDIPLIIWLNGGPGCSSMDGVWIENGPFRLTQTDDDDAWTIDISEHSWHRSPAYVLYVDQPVGTGLSFTTSEKYATNDLDINTDFYYFLNQFFLLHSDKFLVEVEESTTSITTTTTPKKSRLGRPFFFSGESYAGHYIPSMMNFIRQQNLNDPQIHMPLTGAAIGNGWFDPVNQFNVQQAAYGHGILGRQQVHALDEKERKCREGLSRMNDNDTDNSNSNDTGDGNGNGTPVPNVCYEIMDNVIAESGGTDSPYRVSHYDNRKFEKAHTEREFPPGHKIVEAYLGGWDTPENKPNMTVSYRRVLEAIHASPSNVDDAGGGTSSDADSDSRRYSECKDEPYYALGDGDEGVTSDIIDLLNDGIKLLFFNGVHDLICNHVGNEVALEHLEWKHQSEYLLAQRYAWTAPTSPEGAIVKVAGYMKEYANLLFLKVLDSGHMVPMDVPLVALDMMRALIYNNNRNSSFKTYEQEITPKAATPKDDSCPVCSSSITNARDTACPDCQACGGIKEDDDDDDSSADSNADGIIIHGKKEVEHDTTQPGDQKTLVMRRRAAMSILFFGACIGFLVAYFAAKRIISGGEQRSTSGARYDGEYDDDCGESLAAVELETFIGDNVDAPTTTGTTQDKEEDLGFA
jgi:carboxypeptidase D